MSGTDMTSRTSCDKEDAHRRKYSLLPICPELVMAVTSVTLPVLAQRKLVCFLEFNDQHFSIIKTNEPEHLVLDFVILHCHHCQTFIKPTDLQINLDGKS